MTNTLYKECPKCEQAPVTLQNDGTFSCQACGLTVQDRSILGLFRKGQYAAISLGKGSFTLAESALKEAALSPDDLKVAIANSYTEAQLAEIAAGNLDAIRPVKTVLAQIILEQLNEECFVNVKGVRRGHGPALTEESWYLPQQKVSRAGIEWQDEGNIFCTTHRVVLPSNTFTFIRLDRKVVAVQAYADALALQRRGEAFATYFVGCFAHEAALVAAYVMAKIPRLRPAALVED